MIFRILIILLATVGIATNAKEFLGNPKLELSPFSKNYTESVLRIQEAVKTNPSLHNSAYRRLADFSDLFGPRLWGSKNLELAIADLYRQLVEEDFDNPFLQPIYNVTHWVRGKEQLTLYSPRPFPTNIPLIGKEENYIVIYIKNKYIVKKNGIK